MNVRKISLIFPFLIFAVQFVAYSSHDGVSAVQGISLRDKLKLLKGKNRLRYNDYKSAYNLLNEVYQKDPKNPKVNYLLGQCLIASEDFKQAVQHLETAVESNLSAQSHLYLGIAYHRSGQLDKALTEFDNYKKQVSVAKAQNSDVDKYVAQCNLAKEQMLHPQPVKIINLGTGVNSKYPDYSPSVTADGKTLIFTSRRPDTKGKKMDENDFMFYEDIYMSRWDDANQSWSTASNNIDGLLNTKFHDANLSISANGKQILVYRNVPGETKSGDIYYSDLTNTGKWSEPKPFGSTINTTYFESSACLTPDGKTLYFVSERKGGYGRGDIYESRKTSTNEWGEAKSLGDMINTEGDEISLFLHPDGKTLYFSSDGRNGLGGYDIYKTTYVDGKWMQPLSVGYPINTVGDDLYFTITSDNVAYYVSDQESGLGAEDIYQIQFLKPNIETAAKKELPTLAKEEKKVEELPQKEAVNAVSEKREETFEGASKKEVIVSQTVQQKEQVIQSTPLVEKKKTASVVNTNVFEVKYIPFEVKNSEIKLSDQQEAELNAMIDYLTLNTTAKVQVSVNEVGDSYQRLLAQNRAWNVAGYFRQNGVEYSNVIISGTDKGNDRVVVKIIK